MRKTKRYSAAGQRFTHTHTQQTIDAHTHTEIQFKCSQVGSLLAFVFLCYVRMCPPITQCFVFALPFAFYAYVCQILITSSLYLLALLFFLNQLNIFRQPFISYFVMFLFQRTMWNERHAKSLCLFGLCETTYVSIRQNRMCVYVCSRVLNFKIFITCAADTYRQRQFAVHKFKLVGNNFR